MQNENILSCGHYKSVTLNKSVKIPVTNLSENLLKLKKGQRLAEITVAECAENRPIEINSVCLNDFDIKEIDLSHWPNGFAKDKLKTILIDYYDKHTIQLYDDTPGTSKPRTVPYAYQSEIFN